MTTYLFSMFVFTIKDVIGLGLVALLALGISFYLAYSWIKRKF